MIDFVKKIILKVGYKVIFAYWFLFNPTLLGIQLVIKQSGKILLAQHTYMHKGLWDFPGGRVDQNELPIDAARREMMEEIGVDPKEIKQIAEFELFNSHHLDHIHLFECAIENETIKIDKGEIKTVGWFDLNEIPSNLSPVAEKIRSIL